MGDSKGGDRGSPPFGASKSVAFAQHRNKEAIPAFFSGNGCTAQFRWQHKYKAGIVVRWLVASIQIGGLRRKKRV
ncbi:MAG: hypothetical protein A3E85_05930 [Gammaproteobacteria bacterium RIFCSPHIGHO2_12_FULL_45_12]|nr:MAG: hypothetical protein A3E85_05930 [Gammaproteobacteria bacterium RIFCSPHIGHO2_12_FULL_45_12]